MMIVGAGGNHRNTRTELLDLSNWTWSDTVDYPSNSLSDYFSGGGLVYIYPHFYMFGGSSYGVKGSLDEIHRYDEFEHAWEADFGKLNTPRALFSFILKDYTLMIYGGFSENADSKEENMTTERCIFEGDSISCTTLSQPIMNARKPFLFFVEDDFCRGLGPSN